MAKESKGRFVLNLKLNTELFEEDILDKRFEIGRQIYNAVLGNSLKRYFEMTKTKIWRYNQNELSKIYKLFKDDRKELNKLCRPYYEVRNSMLKEFRIDEYSLHKDVKYMQHIFKDNIDAFTAQKIASRVWAVLNDNLFGKGEKVHFKGRNNPLNSLEGKSNGSGIVYKTDKNILVWNRLSIPVQNRFNDYEVNALINKICFCRVKRKFIRGRYKYILQLVLEGTAPVKVNIKTGEVKDCITIGKVGIDIGTQTIAYTSNYDIKLLELAPRVQNVEDKKRVILRYMDRSKRITNTQNFIEDGTIKKGVELKWNYSKKYIKARNELKDLYRKQADIRRQDHNIMASGILMNCDTVYVENMNFKSLQKRVKKTETNDKGKFKKKKRFGKSLANKAPSMFLTILHNKLKAKGGVYFEINTREVKASQYNHLSRQYDKKKLSQRWNIFEYNGEKIKVQRDIYSSYLIKNVNKDLKSVNNEQCTNDFDRFLAMHNKEVLRLRGLNNLSSIGI